MTDITVGISFEDIVYRDAEIDLEKKPTKAITVINFKKYSFIVRCVL